MISPLEQERLALLTKMHLSRIAYKKILTEGNDKHSQSESPESGYGSSNFPKSLTLRYITTHPWMFACISVCIIYIAAQSGKKYGWHNWLKNQHNRFSVFRNPLKRLMRISKFIMKNPTRLHIAKWIEFLLTKKLKTKS